MKKFRQFFQEKIILSAVMCVLLAVVLVSATYGWYALSNSAKAGGIDLKAGEISEAGEIEVRIKPRDEGGVDIMTKPPFNMAEVGEKEYAIVSFPLNEFENIEKQMIAPGAYNYMTFYITSKADNVKSYSIKVQLGYKPSESSDEISEEQIKEIEKIIRDHITVYPVDGSRLDENGNGKVSFDNPLTYYEKENDTVNVATGKLEYDVEKKVQIYWVWNYEATDVPGGYKAIQRFAGLDPSSAIRKYDEEDTIIGNYIEGIYFNVVIKGGL